MEDTAQSAKGHTLLYVMMYALPSFIVKNCDIRLGRIISESLSRFIKYSNFCAGFPAKTVLFFVILWNNP